MQTTKRDTLNIRIKPEAYAEFLARLNMPAQPNEQLRETMQIESPWKKNSDNFGPQVPG